MTRAGKWRTRGVHAYTWVAIALYLLASELTSIGRRGVVVSIVFVEMLLVVLYKTLTGSIVVPILQSRWRRKRLRRGAPANCHDSWRSRKQAGSVPELGQWRQQSR